LILNAKLTCPSCGAEYMMKDAVDLESIRQIARLAAQFGRGWGIVESYLKCFQTAPHKPLKPDKMLILLEEVAQFWQEEYITFAKERYRINQATLLKTMRYVGMLQKTGFNNHNYLKKVAINFQNEANAQKTNEERKHEAELRSRRGSPEDGAKKVGEIIKGLEKK
jgi:hypothetical protein